MAQSELTVALAGYGAIGAAVGQRLNAGIEGLKLSAVAVRDRERAARLTAAFDPQPRLVTLSELAEHADIVVECAPSAVFMEVAEPALRAGRIFVPASVGAILDHPEVIDLASLDNRAEYDPNMLRENLMFGTPDEVIAKLKAYEALGVDNFLYCASYGLPLARGLKYLPSFRLVRMSADQGPDPFPDWQYDQRPTGDGRAYLEEVLAETGKLTQALPEDVAAVELGARMVLVYWLEKPGSTEALVPDLASAMGAFGDSLNRLDRQIEEDRSSNDS